jgi:hypothetical protein
MFWIGNTDEVNDLDVSVGVPHPDELPRNVKENPDSPDSSDSSGDEKDAG